MRSNQVIFGVLGLALLAGCGGGSGSGLATRVAVLATDSLREDYDQVWATVTKIELLPSLSTDAAVTLFTDPNGRVLDLRSLRGAAGQFYTFLGEASVPAGRYTGVRVALASTLQLFATGSATATTASLAEGSGSVVVPFAVPRSFGTGEELVLDFDLARFTLSAGRLTPALALGDGAGLTLAERHQNNDYHGLVVELKGLYPTQTFTLNRGNGQSVSVVTTAATAIFGDNFLITGQVVVVEGRYNPQTNRIVASAIEIKGSGEDDPSESVGLSRPMAHGVARAINSDIGTFTITPHQARGFTLSQRTVNIITTPTTHLHTDGGRVKDKAAFFARLIKAPHIKVEGTYDPVTNTLTAKHARLSDLSNDGGWESETHFDGDDTNHDGLVNTTDDADNTGGGGHGH